MKYRTFKLNKLVRDKIVASTKEQGGTVNYKVVKGKTLNAALVDKLVEEALELKGAELTAEELADLQEIIDQIAKNLKISPDVLTNAQDKKRYKNGGFEKGHFIETLTLPADNKWAEYYAADETRFPEIRR